MSANSCLNIVPGVVTPLLGTGRLFLVTRNIFVAAWWLPVGPRSMLPVSWQSDSSGDENELLPIGNETV